MRIGQKTAIVAALFALFSTATVGQLASVPVYANPVLSGVRLAADYSFGMNDESDEASAWSAQGHLGISKVILGAGIGVVDLAGDNEMTYMGSLAYRVLGTANSLASISLQAGLGMTSVSVDSLTDALKTRDIPLSMGIGIHLPLIVAQVEPWVAPRYTFRRQSSGDVSDNRNHWGLSAGIDARLFFGLGLQVAVDFRSLPELSGNLGEDLKREPFFMNVGLHFGI